MGFRGGSGGSGFYRHAYLFRIPKKPHVLESQYSWQLICPKIRDLCSPIYIFFLLFFFSFGRSGYAAVHFFFCGGVRNILGNVWGGGGYQIFRDLFQIPSNPHSTCFMTSPLRSGHNRCI